MSYGPSGAVCPYLFLPRGMAVSSAPHSTQPSPALFVVMGTHILLCAITWAPNMGCTAGTEFHAALCPHHGVQTEASAHCRQQQHEHRSC